MSRPGLEDIRRFLSKVYESSKGCWLWKAHRSPEGYGQFRLEGTTQWAHRVSYAIFNGEIEKGQTVDHRCLVSSCVNPHHLVLMSRSDNTAESNRRRNGGGKCPYDPMDCTQVGEGDVPF
jgi:hypothetical protein